jgi:hypothetical protein
LQPEKCTDFSANQSNIEEIARLVGCKVRTDSIVAAGCPMGNHSLVTQETIKSAQKVDALLQKLDIELSAQDEVLLLRKYLQLKVSHLARCGEYEHIQQDMFMEKQAAMQAILQIIAQQGRNFAGHRATNVAIAQGRLSLQCRTANNRLVCKAGFTAAAALTQEAMAAASESLQPCKGECGALLQQV